MWGVKVDESRFADSESNILGRCLWLDEADQALPSGKKSARVRKSSAKKRNAKPKENWRNPRARTNCPPKTSLRYQSNGLFPMALPTNTETSNHSSKGASIE